MTIKKRIVAVEIACLICLIPTSAIAQTVNGLTIFGDSLSDNGNAFKALGGLFPSSPPYFNGRFSNGPVWVENLSADLQLTTTANFAFGGATSGTDNTVNPLLPGVATEVNRFLQTSPMVDPNRIYVVWAGANDYLGAGVTNPLITVNNISASIERLNAAGAQRFIVPNLPDLGKIPGGLTNPIQSAALSQLSALHNRTLQANLQSLAQSNQYISIVPLDIAALFNEVAINPARFGFSNVTQSCLNLAAASLCSNPSQFLFWDSLHPTTAGHKIISDYALSILTAPQTIAPQTEIALNIAHRPIRDLNGRLLGLRTPIPNSNQRLGVFVNGDFNFGDRDTTSTNTGFDFNTKGVTVGADYSITKNAALGLAFSYANGDSDLNNDLGNISVNSYSVSAYGSYFPSRFYADAVLNYGWNDFDITRKLKVTGFNRATGSTNGNQFSVRVSSGYNLGSNSLSFGPTVGVRYTRVNIDGYTESNGNILNLKVNDQEVNSLILNVGVQASYTFPTSFGTIAPYITANYEHEFDNGSREIVTELVTQPGIPMRSKTNETDRDFARLSAGVQAQLANNLSAAIGYETTVGKENVSDHYVQAQIRYQF